MLVLECVVVNPTDDDLAVAGRQGLAGGCVRREAVDVDAGGEGAAVECRLERAGGLPAVDETRDLAAGIGYIAFRDRLLSGMNKYQAMRSALLVVGPACALTSLAAGLSFVALMLSDSHLIRTFGAASLALLAALLSRTALCFTGGAAQPAAHPWPHRRRA